METDTKVYLRKKFMQYYGCHEVAAPAEVASREFGTGTLETKIKVRHKSFASQRDLNNFLKREVPFYISYSAAYYEFPENQPMTAKNWRGADLVFDLDSDMKMLSEKKLAAVKEETQNLLDFLLTDFGFPKSDIEINFSGGKGYHIKVFSESVKKLGGIERRSIVDYVSGSGLDIKDFLSLEAEGGHPVVRGPQAGEGGWRGRVYGVMMDLLSMDVTELQELPGIGPKKAQALFDNRERFRKALSRGSWGDFAESSQALISRVLKKYAVKAAQDIDGSVTIDTTRLIRLPDTLHGGSGLVAKRVGNLDSFDPLRDALAFGNEEVRIQLKEEVSFDLGGGGFHLFPGIVSVPEYAAVYLLLKDAAEVVR